MGQWEPSEVLIRLLLSSKRFAEIVSLPLPHPPPNYFLFEATQNLRKNKKNKKKLFFLNMVLKNEYILSTQSGQAF